ncbi:hypothetical protein PR002_g18279 [Phytophthora rubi]|uniref:Pentacotripeptide-repeat region of PRORP domain-containing protein n=1 Tax=Phytophthora rubi TaxID=129364 RepID=A0A6A3K757_9STRA|nr:hypothetical protein PR002_g18279 [Phytophthora rubi]
MLSVRRNLRRATASLLRRQARHTPIARLIPAHGAARSSLQLRAFSQKNDNSETFMGRLKSTAWDVKVTAIDMIQEARGLELTDYEGTVMLESSAAGKKIDNCIELLRYCEENHVSPWPEARLKAFRVLCDARELEVALQLYESLCKDDMELKPWMVGRALDAATKLNRPEAVLKYFQILIPKNCDVRSGERVGDMFRQVCEQGGEMDEFALRSIAIFADRAGEADLALEVLSLAKKRAGGAPVDMHMSVMTVYGKQERWMELVKLYDEMPKIFCWKLKSNNLGLIIRAHALSGKRGVAARGPEIFKKDVKKKQWGTVTCNAMLEALLHTRQFNELLVIADEMRQKDVEWTSSSYKMVTLAHIETGTAEQAKEILLANADKIDDRGLECYRELVVYHSKVRRDPAEACQLYLEMVQNGVLLEPSDWTHALKLSRDLPDQTMYSRLDKHLQQHKSSSAPVPPRLLLPEREEKHEQSVTQAQSEIKQVQFEQVEPETNATTQVSPELKSISDKWNAGGEELTETEAVKLFAHFADNKRIDECVKLLRYCEKRGISPASSSRIESSISPASSSRIESGISPASSSRIESFRALCDANELKLALDVYRTLSKETDLLPPWVYGGALDAAIKLNRKDIVSQVLHRLVRDVQAFDGYKWQTRKGVHAMMRQARDRLERLPMFALRSLANLADRSGELELAVDVYTVMKDRGMKVTLDVYDSLLNAYGQNERWNDVMELYNSMPEHQRQLLRGAGQSWVLLASSHYDGQKAMPHGVRSSKTKPISKNGDAYTPKPGVSDVVLARKTFEDIKEQGNSGKRLSNNLASALISTMAKHGRISDCIDMLSYFEKQGVTTKLFADRAVFNAFCRADKFERALQVFERLSKAGSLDPWVYGWAMNAATQLDRQEVLAAIFRVLVPEYDTDVTTTDSFQVDTTYDLVYEMLQDACSRGVDLSEPALRSFATFAFKAAHSDLALTVVSISQNGNSSVSREIVEAALTSCCFDSRWSDVIRVFEDTPANLRPNLASDSLGAVMKAYARSGDEFFALELFENHKAKWGKFACNIALDVLLETDQADAALTLAKDMKRHGVKWNSRTYTAVALAYIRSGLLDEARVFLSDNAKLLQNCSYGAYRELIECYMNARGDNLTACQLIVDLIENNKEVEFSDWQDALQLAYELPDRDLYWHVRKLLWLRGRDLEDKIPSHLMLTERESPVGRGFRAESSSVAHHIPLMPAEVSLALEVFDDIWNADGSGLTRNTAIKLLTTMIKHKHISDCVEMVDYFKERRVLPKPFACAAAFNLLCDAKEDDLALQLFEGMLQDGMFLSGGDCIRALNVAMKLDNHELASSIGDYMKENVMHADERQAH